MKGWLILILLVIPILGYSYFNIQINLESDRISTKESLNLNINIVDREDNIKLPIFLSFIIKDSNDNIIVKETRTMIIDDELNISKSLYLPNSIKPGNYLFLLQMEQENKTFEKSVYFSVYESKEIKISRYINYIIFASMLISVVIILILVISQRIKLKNISKTINKKLEKIRNDYIKNKEKERAINKLENQKELLKESYKMRYLSKRTFSLSNNKIDRMINIIKKNRKL